MSHFDDNEREEIKTLVAKEIKENLTINININSHEDNWATINIKLLYNDEVISESEHYT